MLGWRIIVAVRVASALNYLATQVLSPIREPLLMEPRDGRQRGTPHPGPLPFGRREGEASSGYECSPCYELLSNSISCNLLDDSRGLSNAAIMVSVTGVVRLL